MNKVLCLFLMLVPFWSIAQTAEISFKNDVHDFGNIKEADGPVTAVFTFTNTGNSPLILNKVDASCGCTTPEWTKSPIMPGKTGVVKAIYDPANRPDRFDKTVTIYSNAKKNSQVVVRIKGNVIPKVLSLEEQYPYAVGQVRLKRSSIEMSRIMAKTSKTETIEIINTGKKPAIVSFEKVPEHIQLTAIPISIPAGKNGQIRCVYNSSKKNDFGPTNDIIVLKVNSDKGNLKINAIVDEDFSKLSSEELKKAPKAQVENTSFKFGSVKRGAKVKLEFQVKNIGLSDLVVHKIYSECNCISGLLQNIVIRAGESKSIGFDLDLKDEKGTGEKFYSISLTTNDPSQRQIYLYAIGTLE